MKYCYPIHYSIFIFTICFYNTQACKSACRICSTVKHDYSFLTHNEDGCLNGSSKATRGPKGCDICKLTINIAFDVNFLSGWRKDIKAIKYHTKRTCTKTSIQHQLTCKTALSEKKIYSVDCACVDAKCNKEHSIQGYNNGILFQTCKKCYSLIDRGEHNCLNVGQITEVIFCTGFCFVTVTHSKYKIISAERGCAMKQKKHLELDPINAFIEYLPHGYNNGIHGRSIAYCYASLSKSCNYKYGLISNEEIATYLKTNGKMLYSAKSKKLKKCTFCHSSRSLDDSNSTATPCETGQHLDLIASFALCHDNCFTYFMKNIDNLTVIKGCRKPIKKSYLDKNVSKLITKYLPKTLKSKLYFLFSEDFAYKYCTSSIDVYCNQYTTMETIAKFYNIEKYWIPESGFSKERSKITYNPDAEDDAKNDPLPARYSNNAFVPYNGNNIEYGYGKGQVIMTVISVITMAAGASGMCVLSNSLNKKRNKRLNNVNVSNSEIKNNATTINVSVSEISSFAGITKE